MRYLSIITIISHTDTWHVPPLQLGGYWVLKILGNQFSFWLRGKKFWKKKLKLHNPTLKNIFRITVFKFILSPLFLSSHQMIALLWDYENYEKCFLFQLKSSFCSLDIKMFVFLSSPPFLPVCHCFREWLAIKFVMSLIV